MSNEKSKQKLQYLGILFWLSIYSAVFAGFIAAIAAQQYMVSVGVGALALALASWIAANFSGATKADIQSPIAADTLDVASFQVILESLPVALLRLDQNGRIIDVNGAARALLGPSKFLGKSFDKQVEGLGRSMRVRVEESLKGSGHRTTEMGRYLRNGKEVFLQVSLMAMTFEDEVNIVVVLSDKTELKILEAQFVQSQKMQAVGQLAGGVAHDFNNLLTAINGHCDLLLLRHQSGDEDFGDLIQIRNNANRAAALVRQLLAFSRKQTLRPKVLKLSQTLSQLTQLLNRLLGEKVQLVIDIADDLNLVRVDERQLEQVIMNLVVNARDAMLEGGDVLITAQNYKILEPLERDRAIVPVGEYICIKVKDTGTGINPDNLSKIFEPFFTTKRVGEGTGLGLSTVYGIIKQTGGFVFVDSERGKGTEFIIYLPRYEGEPVTVEPQKEVEVASAPLKPASGTILLVEDEAPVRSFASRALRLRGYEVDEADCAEAALEMLKNNDRVYDIYISDIIMPGKDGPSWVREALVEFPDTKVIFMSGYAEDAFDDGKPEIKASEFLQKPFSLAELIESVRKSLAI